MQATTTLQFIGPDPNNQVAFQPHMKIFQDNMKQIFAGYFTKDKKQVLIEKLKYQSDNIMQFYPTFERQMKLRSEISHPNLMQLYFYWIDSNHHVYIVIEKTLIKLVDLIAQKKISQKQKLKYVYQIISVMNYLHHGDDRYIYQHRNIKPSCIYLDKDDNVKLSGLSCIKKVQRIFNKFKQTVVGTPLYNSPEILRRQEYSVKCDVWSAGCLLYQICTGQQLFCQAKTQYELMSLLTKYQPKLQSKLTGEDQILKQIIINEMIVEDSKRSTFQQILQKLNNHPQIEHEFPIRTILSEIKQERHNQNNRYFTRQRPNSDSKYSVKVPGNNPKISFIFHPDKELFTAKIKKNLTTHQHPSRHTIGNNIKYVYDERQYLGQGSFAIVYRGWIENNQQQEIAVKAFFFIFEDINENTDFCRQQKALNKFQNDNILKLIDYFVDDSKKIYLITEKCDMSLHTKVKRQHKISQKQVFTYCMEIINALSYMNKLGYIHRDLKPANILLSKDNHIKISDFGLARLLNKNSLSPHKIQTKCGTIFYQSPQQHNGKLYNYKCDVWAFGCIIYEMLTGQRLFSCLQDIQNIRETNSPHMNKINSKLSQGFNSFWRNILSEVVCYQQSKRKSFLELEKIFKAKAQQFLK